MVLGLLMCFVPLPIVAGFLRFVLVEPVAGGAVGLVPVGGPSLQLCWYVGECWVVVQLPWSFVAVGPSAPIVG